MPLTAAVHKAGVPRARKRKRSKEDSAAAGKERASPKGKENAVAHAGGEPPKSSMINVAEEIAAVCRCPEVRKTFKVLDIIGSGTFSSVYKAAVRGRKSGLVALKRIMPSCRAKFIDREVACLHKLRGEHHVAAIKALLRFEDEHVLVLDYFEHEDFTEYFQVLSISQVRAYMKALLEALAHVHKHHIVHRDIKPANFLYSRKSKRFLLVDFGLAQESTEDGIENHPPSRPRKVSTDRKADHTIGHPVRIGAAVDRDGGPGRLDRRPEQHTVRAGTRGFRAPEVLLRAPTQSPAIDVWSAGVVLLSILAGTSPFFMSNRDIDGLGEIANLCGVSRVMALAKFYGKDLIFGEEVKYPDRGGSAEDLKALCEATCPEHPAHLPTQQGLLSKYKLLEQLLEVEPHKRITAQAALAHPFLSGQPFARELHFADGGGNAKPQRS